MDEPTHIQESQFWDQVADWLIDANEDEADDLSDIAGLVDLDDEFDA